MVLLLLCGPMALLLLVLWGYGKKKHGNSSLGSGEGGVERFYPVAAEVLRFLAAHGISLSKSSRKRDLRRLSLGNKEETEFFYNLKRISYVYLVLFVTAILGSLYGVSMLMEGRVSKEGLFRPLQEETTNYELYANGNRLDVSVRKREYTLEETMESFRLAEEELPSLILGDNPSLEEVRQDLVLPDRLEQYGIEIHWMSSDPEVLGLDGHVENRLMAAEEAKRVELLATLSYGEYDYAIEYSVQILSPLYGREEAFLASLERYLKEQEEASIHEEALALPENFQEEEISYRLGTTKDGYLMVALGLSCAVAIFLGMDADVKKRMKERKEQMLLDYSEIVSKLNILSGAGMSIRSAWGKIVQDYEKQCSLGKENRYAYEEMKLTYYEMQGGISETKAYADFGKRCNVHEYLKLGALLEQNVKKGAKGLARMLQEEALQAFENRKRLAKKLGEEAGTKLLIPMILMLGIVMAIVMIPALQAF